MEGQFGQREVMKCKDNKEASRWNTFEPANRTAPQSVFPSPQTGICIFRILTRDVWVITYPKVWRTGFTDPPG